MGGWGGQDHAPAALPPGKTRNLLYKRLGGPQGRSGQVQKISPPPWFDPGPSSLVASRYTDYATRPIEIYNGWNIIYCDIGRDEYNNTEACIS